MHTRRNFLIQGSIASTALLAFKPFKSLAGTVSRFTGYNGYGKLIFMHTAILDKENGHALIQNMPPINRDNAIVLHAGPVGQKAEQGLAKYDTCINEINNQEILTGGYKIVNKGNIRTGIISAMPGQADVISEVNNLSAWLKREKKCTVVVCLSQLGYKNKNNTDDVTLATSSTYLDLIIGGDVNNFHQQPVIVLNAKNEEVIINSAGVAGDDFGKINIGFNELGKKKHISFNA